MDYVPAMAMVTQTETQESPLPEKQASAVAPEENGSMSDYDAAMAVPAIREKIDGLHKRIATLEEFLHELYHLDKRGLDDDEYDEYRLACDFGEVMKRYMDYRKEQKG